jgi:hypothetical protein
MSKVKVSWSSAFWFAVVAWFGWNLLIESYNDIQISNSPKIATATITDITEDYAENDEGTGGPFYTIGYEFTAYGDDSKKYEGHDTMPYDSDPELGDSIEIEYAVTDPALNRIRDGHRRVYLSWLFLAVCAGVVFYILYVLSKDIVQIETPHRDHHFT